MRHKFLDQVVCIRLSSRCPSHIPPIPMWHYQLPSENVQLGVQLYVCLLISLSVHLSFKFVFYDFEFNDLTFFFSPLSFSISSLRACFIIYFISCSCKTFLKMFTPLSVKFLINSCTCFQWNKKRNKIFWDSQRNLFIFRSEFVVQEHKINFKDVQDNPQSISKIVKEQQRQQVISLNAFSNVPYGHIKTFFESRNNEMLQIFRKKWRITYQYSNSK